MIFCDMDGVLTDFDGEFERRFGMPPHAIPRPELWEKVLAAKDYWYDLPKTGGADKLVGYLNRFQHRPLGTNGRHRHSSHFRR